VTTQINTIEISPELANMAYEMGLNIQKTCENGLKEAIRRLQGFNSVNDCVRNAEVANQNGWKSCYLVVVLQNIALNHFAVNPFTLDQNR
jgi:exonuclease VII small subunit